MKKKSVLAAVFCLLFAALSVSAQDRAADFTGNWELDVARSKLPPRIGIETVRLNVSQNENRFTVSKKIKRTVLPEGFLHAIMPQDLRDGSVSYSLEGNETIVESETPRTMKAASMKLKAYFEKDGKLKLVTTQNVETAKGWEFIKTVETWEQLDAGKTLKITRDTETLSGTEITEMFFAKKDATDADGEEIKNSAEGLWVGMAIVKNGKNLIKPPYPAGARASQARGAVAVRITVDEQGKVVSATATSGNTLFRNAAEKAARKSTFFPTLIEGKPVKVTGVVVYNFVP